MSVANDSCQVAAWVRRRHTMGMNGLNDIADTKPRAQHLRQLWQEQFPNYSYDDFRAFLSRIADAHSSIPRVDNWQDSQAEWIAPVDDDDWHLPGLADALTGISSEFMMVCWPVEVADLTSTAQIYVEPISWQLGPQTCGYAVHRSFLKNLTPRQLNLIRDDHRNAHRYVDWSGYQYLFLNGVFGVYARTPASISSIKETSAKLNFATVEKYFDLLTLPECRPGVDKIIKQLINLIR